MEFTRKALKGLLYTGLVFISSCLVLNKLVSEKPVKKPVETKVVQVLGGEASGEPSKERVSSIVDIGYAYDGKKPKKFLSKINEANKSLMGLGIYLDVNEVAEIDSPRSFGKNDFIYGVKHSFFRSHDYYFVWTSSDYSVGDSGDYAVKAFTKEGVCLIDKDFNEKNLEKLVAHEILRCFINKEDRTLNEKDKLEFSDMDKKVILANFWLENPKFKSDKSGYDLTTNLKEPRTVSVNIGFDTVKKEGAEKIFVSVSELYSKEFNISFNALGFYEHKLPESWSTIGEIRKLKKSSKKKSDIYVLLTDRDWKDDDDGGAFSSVAGQAIPGAGYTWIETHHKDKEVVNIIAHELGHLFGARHIYRRGSLMHPSANYNKGMWMPKTKETILKNKFRNWNK